MATSVRVNVVPGAATPAGERRNLYAGAHARPVNVHLDVVPQRVHQPPRPGQGPHEVRGDQVRRGAELGEVPARAEARPGPVEHHALTTGRAPPPAARRSARPAAACHRRCAARAGSASPAACRRVPGRSAPARPPSAAAGRPPWPASQPAELRPAQQHRVRERLHVERRRHRQPSAGPQHLPQDQGRLRAPRRRRGERARLGGRVPDRHARTGVRPNNLCGMRTGHGDRGISPGAGRGD